MSTKHREGREPSTQGVDDLRGTVLAPAFDAALSVARSGVVATPYIPVPERLRPYLRTTQPTLRMWAAIHEVLDTDPEFRARVRDAVDEETVGRAGWLFLARPPGWSDDLALALAVGQEPAEPGEPPTDEPVARAGPVEPPAPRPRPATAPADTDLAARISALRAELGRLRATRLLAADAPMAPEPDLAVLAEDSEDDDTPGEPGWLLSLSATTVAARALADQLAELVASFGPDQVAPVATSGADQPRARRRPVPTPAGIEPGTPAAAHHLLRLVGGVVLVDGTELLRRRPSASTDTVATTLRALGALADRTGASFEVALSSDDAAAALDIAHWNLRLRFTPPGLSARQLLSILASGYPVERPVVVVGDRTLVEDASRRHGANVIPVDVLVALLDGAA